jgi:hypothetical protein
MSDKKIEQRERCSYADKYKAIREPQCGCKACERKWALAQIKKERKK